MADPEWGQWLSHARLGNWSEDLRSYIENIPDFGTSNSCNYRGLIQTISTDTATRTFINDMAVQIVVQSLGHERRVFVIPARLSRRISPNELAVIRGLTDNKTGNIASFLHVYIGMPVRIKANQCVAKGVANGATGHVHHIDWPSGTSFTRQQNGTWLASNQPTNLYVNIDNSPSPTPFPLLPVDWPSSVMPVYKVTAQVTIHGPSLFIKGFPVVPAFGTTVHGMQGETRDAIAVTDLPPPNLIHVDPHALYVVLSRVKTRQRSHLDRHSPFRPRLRLLSSKFRSPARRYSITPPLKLHTVPIQPSYALDILYTRMSICRRQLSFSCVCMP